MGSTVPDGNGHRSQDDAGSHTFTGTFAHCVESHMRRRLAPLLCRGDDRVAARVHHDTPVETALIPQRAKCNDDTETGVKPPWSSG